MKFNFSKEFFNRDGRAFRLNPGEGEKNLIAKDACLMALDYISPDVKISPEEKYKRYSVGKKVEALEAEFSAEEVATIKKALGEFPAHPLLYGQLCDFLDGKEVK